jgi:hypothetical protein
MIMAIKILAKINAYSKVSVILPEPTVNDIGKVVTVDENLDYVYMSPLNSAEVNSIYESVMAAEEAGE